MPEETVDTLVIGAGQAGLAMSEHLSKRGISHLIVERDQIVESWRSRRWDSLVANGPAWHDRFPTMEFEATDPDGFATKAQVVRYFEDYARQIAAPVRCDSNVTRLTRLPDGSGFQAETAQGAITAKNVVIATGPFQRPRLPAWMPASPGITQIHSSDYRNPGQLAKGAVLVVGAGSSGVQIADELLRSGRAVTLAVGPHNRPPRRYRGRDFCWWLGVLGKWDAERPDEGSRHVTIAVSGARGGHTVDFRELASRGMTLTGRACGFSGGVMQFAPDLKHNVQAGDADYLSVLDEADAFVAREGLNLPEEPEARNLGPDPLCMVEPVEALHLERAGITTIVWGTGYQLDFGWLHLDAFDEDGAPAHKNGVSAIPGLYFVGLPWLSTRSSAFIWGVWRDAERMAGHIAERSGDPVPKAYFDAPDTT